MDLKDDINTFKKGCENSDSQYRFSRQRKLRLALFIAIGIFCSRYREAEDGDLVFLFGRLHEKILGDSDSAIHHAASAASIRRMRKCATLFSAFRFTERLHLVADALKRAKMMGAGDDKARLVEYRFFAETIARRLERHRDGSFKVITASMTDRYVTWISGLCKSEGLMLDVYQHGTLLHFKGMPHRITATSFYTYNEFEEKCIKQYIVENADCNYVFIPFESNVSFSQIERKEGGYYIGVISQHNKEFNHDAVETISKLYPEARILLMLHPVENYDTFYKALKRDFRQLEILESKKIINLDMLVLNNSTMIYDYVYSGYNSTIVVIAKERLYGFLANGIQYFDSFQCWIDEVSND